MTATQALLDLPLTPSFVQKGREAKRAPVAEKTQKPASGNTAASLQPAFDFTQAAIVPPVSPAHVLARAENITTRQVRFISAADVDAWRDHDRKANIATDEKQHRQWRYTCPDCPDARLHHKKSSDVVSRTTHWALEEDDWHNNPKCAQYDPVAAFLKTGKFVPRVGGAQKIVLPPVFAGNLNLLEQFLAECTKSGAGRENLFIRQGRKEIPLSQVYLEDMQSLVDAWFKKRTGSEGPRPQSYILELAPDLSTLAPAPEEGDIWRVRSLPEMVWYKGREFRVFVSMCLASQDIQNLFHGGKIADGDTIRVPINVRDYSEAPVSQIRALNAAQPPNLHNMVLLRTSLADIGDVARTFRAYDVSPLVAKVIEMPDQRQLDLDL